jgi:uncharacterized protein (DUF2141 family)
MTGCAGVYRKLTASRLTRTAAASIAFAGLALAGAGSLAAADQYRQIIDNDLRRCAPGNGPAVRVTVTEIESATGKVRVQVYRGTKAEWLASGRWLYRIEQPAKAGTMTFCLPVPESGAFAIAARHDVNGNGKTDITQDGGAMSNNPSINIFNLGKPGIDKTRIEVGPGVTNITIRMRYM